MKKIGNFEYDPEVLEKLCKENDISYLALFGSYLHGDNKSDSDLDFLVKFSDTSKMSLFDFVRVQLKFADNLGKKVDLVTVDGIDPYIKEKVFGEAKTVYQND
ncbi:MAG: hypothetical protein US96_C0012G0006 [Candidatus Woesebacteria bacterium GW2011_GWB1_38_5b]|uniref:Polymerase beta nucleotidyltransferase domain-containing protein n=1 Tax=Candidatus Woesebacteria bacterium GW2011_GWB1_38_5b TaxID=1618569 RepID=A0A0G0K944_9BACT|nr:MAG: hypothetical protein US96_C0012G0006 [Candidatus Woesebacteria bacterium GW2011_GWB1_38_5b]